MDTRLGVKGWPTPLAGSAGSRLAAADVPDDAPDWWTGENTNEFLAEQGVVLG